MGIRVKSAFIMLLAACGILLIALPHTGIFGFGRPIFIDEAINIDSGVSFLQRGWVTFRGEQNAYSPIVSSGVFGSLIPSFFTEVFQSYVAGRLASAVQTSFSLALVGGALAAICGRPVLVLLFSALSLFIPALPASLIYTQAEPLSFLALSLGFYTYVKRSPLILAGFFFFAAVHLKLLAIVDISGGLAALAALAIIEKSERQHVLRLYVAVFVALAVGFLSWQALQIALCHSWSEYVSSWDSFASFFQSGGSGLRSGSTVKISRWDLLTTSASEFGGYSNLSKALICLFCVIPVIGVLTSLSQEKRNPKLRANELLIVFSGAAIFHLTWWFLKSDQIWIRHGFLGLFSACAAGTLLIGSEVRFRKLINFAAVLLFMFCVVFKTWRGVAEFRREPMLCLPHDSHHEMFCAREGSAFDYVPWHP